MWAVKALNRIGPNGPKPYKVRKYVPRLLHGSGEYFLQHLIISDASTVDVNVETISFRAKANDEISFIREKNEANSKIRDNRKTREYSTRCSFMRSESESDDDNNARRV
jgi:hypothetical protein